MVLEPLLPSAQVEKKRASYFVCTENRELFEYYRFNGYSSYHLPYGALKLKKDRNFLMVDYHWSNGPMITDKNNQRKINPEFFPTYYLVLM